MQLSLDFAHGNTLASHQEDGLPPFLPNFVGAGLLSSHVLIEPEPSRLADLPGTSEVTCPSEPCRASTSAP